MLFRMLPSSFGPPACLIFHFLFASLANALSVNHTVDDNAIGSATQVVYSPSSAWHAQSATSVCAGCTITKDVLDLSKLNSGTWHDATYVAGQDPVQFSLTFSGTAVYVYNVIPNTLPGTTTLVNISFVLDHLDAGQFLHTPTSDSTILYDQLVFSSVGLDNVEHTLTMTSSGRDNSLILYDYFVYTTEVPDTSSSTTALPSPSVPPPSSLPPASAHAKPPVGALVGGIVGGIVALVAVGLAICLVRRRLRQRHLPDLVDVAANKDSGFLHRSDPNSHSNYGLAVVASPPVHKDRRFLGLPTAAFSKRSESHGGPSASWSVAPTLPSTSSYTLVASGPTSAREAELVGRIQELQNQVHSQQSQGGTARVVEGEERSDVGSGGLQAELTMLRGMLSNLTEELKRERRMNMEQLPRYEDVP